MKFSKRQKKLIIVLLFFPFLLSYIAIALALSDYVPANDFVQFLFYVIAGIAWAFPLKPVMSWMNSPDGQEADQHN